MPRVAAVQLLALTLYMDFSLLPGSPLRPGQWAAMDPRGSGQARLGAGGFTELSVLKLAVPVATGSEEEPAKEGVRRQRV